MNHRLHTILLYVLGLMTLMPGISFARDRSVDSATINRVWDYYGTFVNGTESEENNVYMVYSFGTKRRNFSLFLIPTMYSIAKGDREYIGEAYCKLNFRNINDYSLKRQVVSGTIPSHRSVMPTMFEMLTPNLYNTQIYPDKLLSPFHRTNRFFYKYRMKYEGRYAYIIFRPRSANTQLVNGQAYIDRQTGRILSVEFAGKFDMISFTVSATMDQNKLHSVLPTECHTESTFKFMGNIVNSRFEAYYNCPVTLPDSIDDKVDQELIEKLRPRALTEEEQAIYEKRRMEDEAISNDSTPDRYRKLRHIAWDIIGDNMVNSLHANSSNVSLRISPLLNPLYMGYSHSKGISYKLNIGLRYAWNKHRYLSLEPNLGYSFKIKQFYYHLPLRMTYNPKRNGYAEISWGNGNRINNGTLYETYRKLKHDSLASMPDYRDEYVQIVNNIEAFDWLEIMGGINYHRRSSTAKDEMRSVGLPDEYRSFAPMLTIKLTPWRNGPTLTANYERSIKNILRANLSYERWEFDAVYRYKAQSVRILNLRLGTGFYTHRSTDYFVDFTNFRDENLPSGWDDDWTGQFQLIDPRWYNESNYYLRSHVSYDSPLLVLSWLPLLGPNIETERFYLSAMSIQHTRPYFEIGYGIKTRYLSAAVFSSFLNTKFNRIGCKFTVELFRRW